MFKPLLCSLIHPRINYCPWYDLTHLTSYYYSMCLQMLSFLKNALYGICCFFYLTSFCKLYALNGDNNSMITGQFNYSLARSDNFYPTYQPTITGISFTSLFSILQKQGVEKKRGRERQRMREKQKKRKNQEGKDELFWLRWTSDFRLAAEYAAASYADDPTPCLRRHNSSLVLQLQLPCDAARNKVSSHRTLQGTSKDF